MRKLFGMFYYVFMGMWDGKGEKGASVSRERVKEDVFVSLDTFIYKRI